MHFLTTLIIVKWVFEHWTYRIVSHRPLRNFSLGYVFYSTSGSVSRSRAILISFPLPKILIKIRTRKKNEKKINDVTGSSSLQTVVIGVLANESKTEL